MSEVGGESVSAGATSELLAAELEAYNRAFCELELPWRWDAQTFRHLVSVAPDRDVVGAYVERSQPHLLRVYEEAVQRRGVRLILADGTEQVASNVMATRDCVAAGAHELVILAVKAHQLEAVAHDVPHLCGPETVVVTMQNGIPYWYFHHHGGEWAGGVVRSVDPSGIIARLIPPETVVGCVVYPATELIAPGVVKHIAGDCFPVGELDGTSRERRV